MSEKESVMPTKERRLKGQTAERMAAIAEQTRSHIRCANMSDDLNADPRACDRCGLNYAPIPTYTVRHGWGPRWFCVLCDATYVEAALRKWRERCQSEARLDGAET